MERSVTEPVSYTHLDVYKRQVYKYTDTEKEHIMKVVIAGAGKLGMNVANALLGGDHSITIIDTNENLLQKINSHIDVMTINANAKETKILKEINIS